MSDKLNFNAYEEQTRNTSKEFWGTIMELNASHPMTGKRALHLEKVLSDKEVPKIKKNVLGILLALVFNFKFWLFVYIVFIISAIMNGPGGLNSMMNLQNQGYPELNYQDDLSEYDFN